MRPYVIALALSALSVASAQTKNFTIDPNEVPATKRATWCAAEINTCGQLCSDPPTANDCTVADLSFHCTCQNGSAPGLQYYTQTIPTFVCQQAFEDCNNANTGNKTGQDACIANIQDFCGTLDPNKYVAPAAPSSSSSSSSSATSSPTGTGAPSPASSQAGTATTSSSSVSKAAAAAATAAYLGNGAAVVAAGLFAALI